MLEHLEKRPEAAWKGNGTMWGFRNEARVYGSPMFDAVWRQVCHQGASPAGLEATLAQLRAAPVPWQ